MTEPAPYQTRTQSDLQAENDELSARLAASEGYIAATLARATRLTQIVSVLGNDTEVDRVVGRAATTVCELFSADLAALMLGEDDALTVAGHWGLSARDVPTGPIAITHLDELMEGGAIVAGPADRLGLPDWLDRYQARHAAWARLSVAGESLGLLLIVRRADVPFQGSDETELHAIAIRLAMAVENGLLHDRMRTRIEQLAQLQAFTADLTRTLELGAVAQRVVDEVVRVTGSQACAVYVDRPAPIAVSGARLPAADWTRIAITTAAGTVGELAVSRPPAPGGEAGERLTHLLGLAGLALEKALLYERSREQARRDSLTGLLAHRTFHESLQELEERGAPFTLVLADIDDFKQINDLYGHPAGDDALRAVANAISAAVRAQDVVYRIGGEEFCVLLPALDAAGAETIAERLRQRTAMLDAPLPLTVSVGLAAFPEDADNREQLLARADQALYASKGAGKNTTTRADRLRGESRQPAISRHLDLRLLHEQDPATAEHSARVADLAVAVGRELCLEPHALGVLRRAAMLHDIGKIAVPRAILQKPGPLDPDEFRVVQLHCLVGSELLSRAGERDLARIVLQHHENVDGSGYPLGLCCEELQIESRIVRVVDSFAAMTLDRPYRSAQPPEDAVAELQRCAGREFDPTVVDALCAVLAPRLTVASAGITASSLA